MMCSDSQELESPDCSEFVEVDPTGRYGRYNEILGKGASKTVYRAFDEYEGIEVAWNQVKLHNFLQSPEDLERLYCEIHLLKTLKHKNIMKFYTSWVDIANRNINFVTEMFTSGTLKQYRQKHKRVNIRAVKHWCRQILAGLLYLHCHDPPVIHRDLKCDNIFVNGNQGEVKIGDMGLAAILRKSHAAHCVGTPEFMAPEVYKEEYNELVDIYSFGMCILEMVTFEYPYSECTHPAQIYKKVITGKKPDALYKVKDPEVREFVEKCLATVSNRLSARELLNDPFLQIDDYGYDSELMDCQIDFDEMSPILRQPCFEPYHSTGSLFDDYSSNQYYENVGNEWDYDAFGNKHHEINILPDHQDEHLANLEISIKGKRRDDDSIFLRLRIVDKEGRVRNIYFPFDIETDTALSVATEMVAELDITDQDVTKIAEMIDGEIGSLVPEWTPGPHVEETLGYAPSICYHCSSNGSSSTSLIDYFSSGPDGKVLQVPHCSQIGCSAMHGRFEEITYQVKGSDHCLAEDEPASSTQSDSLQCTDTWPLSEGPNLSFEVSEHAHSDKESEQIDETALNREDNLHKVDHSVSSRRKSVYQNNCNSIDNQPISKGLDKNKPISQHISDNYENVAWWKLRWLKAKHLMEMREISSRHFDYNKNNQLESRTADHSVSTASKGESFDLLFQSLALKNHSSPNSRSPDSQNCDAIQYDSPKQIFPAISCYHGAMGINNLHRSKSLPVDAVDI